MSTTAPSQAIETFPNPQPGRDYTIRMRIPEFTCLCPRTGQPDFATLELEYVPDQLCVDADFLLTVKGDSMINAGILDGDFVVVRKQEDARNGEIVVALMGDEDATVKRFFREAGRVRLQPENDDMEPMYPDQVTILGTVRAVLRRL